MLNKLLISSLIIAYSLPAIAQTHLYKRKNRDLVPLSGQMMLSGWHFAPGLTYMLPQNKGLFKSSESSKDVNPKGKFAFYVEAGRYTIFPGGGNVFNYMDYSLAFKRLSGKEIYNGNEGFFKQNYLLGNFNINNIIQLTDYTFIQNSLGVNVDYNLFGQVQSSGSSATEPSKLIAQLHYKLGYGIKVTNNLFIIPILETPILNTWAWEKGKSTLGFFSSRYRPLILTVRFAFLSKRSQVCPPVYNSPDDKKKQEQYMQQR